MLASIAQDVSGAEDMLDNSIDFYRISKLYADHFDIVRADTPGLLDSRTRRASSSAERASTRRPSPARAIASIS